MIDLLLSYVFFLLKVVTVLVAILIPILVISNSKKNRIEIDKGKIVVKNLSERISQRIPRRIFAV